MPEIPLWQGEKANPELRMPRVPIEEAGRGDMAMAKTIGEIGQISVEMGKKLAEKKFLDGAEKIQQGFQGQIGNARIQQQVQSDFGHHLLSYTTQLRHSVVQQQSINAKSDLLTNMNSLLNMGVSGDELIAGQSKEKFANLVAASIATGSIRADAGKEMVLKFNQELDEGRLKRLIVLAPPGTATKALAAGMFGDIPEADRVT